MNILVTNILELSECRAGEEMEELGPERLKIFT